MLVVVDGPRWGDTAQGAAAVTVSTGCVAERLTDQTHRRFMAPGMRRARCRCVCVVTPVAATATAAVAAVVFFPRVPHPAPLP